MEYDPVCGMKVKEGSEIKSSFQGKTFYFCCQHCKEEFDRSPLKYSRR